MNRVNSHASRALPPPPIPPRVSGPHGPAPRDPASAAQPTRTPPLGVIPNNACGHSQQPLAGRPIYEEVTPGGPIYAELLYEVPPELQETGIGLSITDVSNTLNPAKNKVEPHYPNPNGSSVPVGTAGSSVEFTESHYQIRVGSEVFYSLDSPDISVSNLEVGLGASPATQPTYVSIGNVYYRVENVVTGGEATKRLKLSEPGEFVLRPSKSEDGVVTIAIKTKNLSIRHFKVDINEAGEGVIIPTGRDKITIADYIEQQKQQP